MVNLFVCCPFDAAKMAVPISGRNIAYRDLSVSLCLDRASRCPQLERIDTIPRSFLVILAFLILWWGTAFSAIGWMLTEASAPPPFRAVPLGVFATIDLPHLGALT